MGTDLKNLVWSDDLVITKLNIPSLHFKVMRRTRLTDLLHPDMDTPIMTVVAPAGFGKTTFMVDSAEKLKESGWTVLWLSLDAHDNSLVKYWSYILAGIKNEVPVKINSMQFLQQVDDYDYPRILSPLINTIAGWNAPVLLVLDDYHVITHDSIHQSMAYLIAHQPENLHILISSRKNIPIPLWKQKAECKLLEITAKDLAFSFSEADTFLNRILNLGLDPTELSSFYRQSEGWILALQLFGISMQGKSDHQALSKQSSINSQHLSEYLLNEVLDKQEKSVSEFLIQSSVLNEISPAFCDAVFSRDDSAEMIHTILDANLFLMTVDETRGWYRYHPLFSQALSERLAKSDPEAVKQIYRRSYLWLRENAYPSKAVSYAITAGDIEEAAEIIENCALQAIVRYDTVSLVSWINQISREILINRPDLMLYNAFASLLLGQHERVEPELQKLENALEENPRLHLATDKKSVIYWKIAAIRAVMLCWEGDIDQGIPEIKRLLASVPKVEPYFLGFLINSRSEIYALSEDYTSSAASFVKTREFSKNNGLFDEYLNASCELGRIDECLGKINEAKLLFQTALDDAANSDASEEAIAFLKSGLLEIAIIRHDIESAEKIDEELSQISVGTISNGYPWIYQIMIQMRLAKYYLWAGKTEEALLYTEWIGQHLQNDRMIGMELIDGIVQVKTEIWLRDKKYDLAEDWLVHRIGENDCCNIHSTVEKMMLCKVKLAQNKPKNAISISLELEGYLTRKGMIYPLIEVLVLQSMAYKSAGMNQKSIIAMKKAIELAAQERIVHPFVKGGQLVCDILIDLFDFQTSKSGDTELQTVFVSEIIQCIDYIPYSDSLIEGYTENSSKKYLLQRILTDREREIFEKLMYGISEKDIALEDMISINTVKAHVRNIYKKLEIHNRREAHQWLHKN